VPCNLGDDEWQRQNQEQKGAIFGSHCGAAHNHRKVEKFAVPGLSEAARGRSTDLTQGDQEVLHKERSR